MVAMWMKKSYHAREILMRANATPEIFAEFDRNVRAWSRGSVYLDLADLQYTRLKSTRRAQPPEALRTRSQVTELKREKRTSSLASPP